MTRLWKQIWRGVCYLTYASGVGPFCAWLWRRRFPQVWTVLAYHRVGRPVHDGGPDHVTVRRFRRHLKYLRKRYEVLPVGEALKSMLRGEPRRRPLLSITFDDGYRDNLSLALPILLEEDCRATLYPTLEAIEEGRAPWTHRLGADLQRLARRPAGVTGLAEQMPEAVRRIVAGAAALSERDLTARIDDLVGEVKQLPDAERVRVCALVSESAGPAESEPRPMLTAEELRQWTRAGMEVGSHTYRHPILSRLGAFERRDDLARSRQGLERILGVPVVHLAYPNGRGGDMNLGTIEDVRATGFASAVTTIEGFNKTSVDPFQIRRISVGNDSLPVFASRISPLFARVRSWLHARATRVAAHRSGERFASTAGRPLRIAFIGGRGIGSAYSGIERYYEEVGSRLVMLGHEVLAYCRPHFSPEAPVFRGLQVRRLPTVRSKHLETLVHTILATIDVCFRKVDLVQFHALGSSPFAWIPRLAGKRTVVSVRGLDWQRAKWGWVASSYLRFCESTSMHCPNATAVVSRTLQRHFERRFRRPVRYIPNGVARTEGLSPDGIRRWGLGRRDYFLYAGRLSPEKRLDVAIEAHRPIQGLRLVIAGGSSYSNGYVERLRSEAQDQVVFTGLLTGTLLQEIYSNALAFVLPSRMEGLSVALLEAMSYGLPVIASDIPENRELIDECGGYLFRLDDAADLRRVMQTVAGSPEMALRVGERARTLVRERFDWDRIAADTADFYKQVMAGSAPATATGRSSVAALDAQPSAPAPSATTRQSQGGRDGR